MVVEICKLVAEIPHSFSLPLAVPSCALPFSVLGGVGQKWVLGVSYKHGEAGYPLCSHFPLWERNHQPRGSLLALTMPPSGRADNKVKLLFSHFFGASILGCLLYLSAGAS